MDNHQHEIRDVNHLREELDSTTSGMSEMALNTSHTLASMLAVIENLRKTVEKLEARVASLEKLVVFDNIDM